MGEQKIFDEINCCGTIVKVNPSFIFECETICDMLEDIKDATTVPVLCPATSLKHLHEAWLQTRGGTSLQTFVEESSPQRIACVINTASYLGMEKMRWRLNHFLAENCQKYPEKIRALFKKPAKRKMPQKRIKSPRKRQKK